MRSDELLFFIGRGYISAAHMLSKFTYRSKAISKSKKTIRGKAISIIKKTIRGKAISIDKIIKIISLTALQKAQYMIK